LRQILADENGAIAPGIADPIFARLVEDCGFPAIHLSGNALHKNFCLPDSNLVTVTEVAQRAAHIAEATNIPLIVDGGTGCGAIESLRRTVALLERAGAAAIRFEDSSVHRTGDGAESISVASKDAIVDSIKAATDARSDSSLTLIMRCDARPKETLAQVHERLMLYIEAGADAVGVQLSNVDDFRQTAGNVSAPLVTMWPRSLMTAAEFLRLGFRIALMPSSVALAAIGAARTMLSELKESGTERDYFTRQKDFADTERWYKELAPGKRNRQ
jgi:methylisocitrate lyase